MVRRKEKDRPPTEIVTRPRRQRRSRRSSQEQSRSSSGGEDVASEGEGRRRSSLATTAAAGGAGAGVGVGGGDVAAAPTASGTSSLHPSTASASSGVSAPSSTLFDPLAIVEAATTSSHSTSEEMNVFQVALVPPAYEEPPSTRPTGRTVPILPPPRSRYREEEGDEDDVEEEEEQAEQEDQSENLLELTTFEHTMEVLVASGDSTPGRRPPRIRSGNNLRSSLTSTDLESASDDEPAQRLTDPHGISLATFHTSTTVDTFPTVNRGPGRDAEELEEGQRTQSRQSSSNGSRRRGRRSSIDRSSLHASATTNVTHLTNDDPDFWNIPSRWFGTALPNYTYYAGGERTDVDEKTPVSDDTFRTHGDGPGGKGRGGDGEDDEDLLSEVSSLGDTLTIGGIQSLILKRRREKLKRRCRILLSFPIVVWIMVQMMKGASRWAPTLFSPTRSHRYYPMKEKLIDVLGGGKEVVRAFEVDGSAQQRALLFLSDGDPLLLDPKDPLATSQIIQRYALAVLYYETNGPSWEHRTYWLTGQHECGWIFVVCSDIKDDNITQSSNNQKDKGTEKSANDENPDNTDDDYTDFADSDLGLGKGTNVTGLKMYSNNLQGKLPSELGLLKYLHVLDLGSNHLEGTIPRTMFQDLPWLRELYLNINGFVGSIPPTMTKGLARLKVLAIGNNQLKGTIPPSMFKDLLLLERFNLEGNQLSGTLPDAFHMLRNLEEVRLGENQLNGTIPPTLLGGLSALDDIESKAVSSGRHRHIQQNKGPILSSLTKCDLHGNRFTGELPAILSEGSPSLKYLYLYNNNLSGKIVPKVLCGASESLVDVRLNNNSFVDSIPAIDCTMKELELFSLASNNLTGPIPSSFGEYLPSLREIHLYENNLTSTIPKSLFQPQNLSAVLLGNNALTGSLTADMIGNAKNLIHFYVNDNKLSGNLDDFTTLGNLTSLKKLRLEYNKFTGTISFMKAMDSIELMYLYNNSLTGSLPADFSEKWQLRKFKVSNNTLTGSIPPQLGDLKMLEILSLNGNQFTGEIPSTLGGLKTLKELNLRRNKLSGPVPDKFKRLSLLEELLIDGNDISGVVPNEVCDLRDLLLVSFSSDCGGEWPEITCSCCTECF